MEATDNKGQEPATSPELPKTPPKQATSSPPKQNPAAEKVSVENGSVSKNGEKKEEETSIKLKDEMVKGSVHSNKQNKAPESSNKKTSREEKHSRRKDERSVEQVMRALNSFESSQEKLDALVKKYAEVVDENRKLQTQTKNIERRLTQVEREKDSAQSEHSKSVLARSRLEGLCRELQRQNRAIKEESVLKIREEEEKRKEVSNKFQTTLADITSLMHQNNEKNSKLRDDNIEMTKKFKSVCEQYELRVQQVEKISKQMQLEAQLADAKLAKAHLEGKAEKETLLRDKHELLMELAQYQARAKEQHETELKLRDQVDLYTKKYDEFQSALSRSNEVFGGFKEEMDRMSKKIVKLEKETSTWKQRWEKSHQALLEMATDKQQRDAELSLANRQLTQLHKLCRTLTEERAKLMAQINAEGTPADAAKEEKLAADIAEDRRKLNDTLDSLQSVILERELLHKQQQLEKQQQQLQVELQKHVTTPATNSDSKGKPNNSKATEKTNETKTNDSKSSEVKPAGQKNSESNKKKNRKQKSGRQAVEKQSIVNESKSEGKETDKTSSPEESIPNKTAPQSSTDSVSTATSAEKESPLPQDISVPAPSSDKALANPIPCEEKTAKKGTENMTAADTLTPEASTLIAEPAAPNLGLDATPVSKEEIPQPTPVAEGKPQDLTPKPEAMKPEENNVKSLTETEPSDPVSVTGTANPTHKSPPLLLESASETQVPMPAKSVPQPVLVSSETPTVSSTFSYAAVVGSKAAEQPPVSDQCPNEKTEVKPNASEKETAESLSSNANDSLPSPQATNGLTKPVAVEVPVSVSTKTEEVLQANPSPMPSKKNKKRVGQPLGIKGRTASLFRISKLFGCLKRPSKAAQTHQTS